MEIQVNAAYEAWKTERNAVGGNRVGGPPKPFKPAAVPEGVMNKTDHDSRMMRPEGQPTVQGYNAQAAVTRGQIILAAEIAVQSPGFGDLEPIVNATLRELDTAGVTERPETVLADAGYWHAQRIENIVSDGIQVLVPPDGSLRKTSGPAGTKASMRSCEVCWPASTATGSTNTAKRPSSRYSLRSSSTAINRCQRRGRAAALSERRLVAATHNLLKLVCHER